MLNDKQVEELLYNLSSFYQDYLPIDNRLMKLYQIYAKTIDYVWNVFGEADDGRKVFSTRTLSTIPYFKVDIRDAVYSLSLARNMEQMTSFEKQIALLEKEGKYASFVFPSEKETPAVYGMRLFLNFTDTEPLRLYEDYFVRNNRLYLLPHYIRRRKKPLQFLHAFDIKINDFTLEKNYGTYYNIEAGPLLPRYEYRDVLEAYMRAFKGKMTIKAIKESLRLATKWENFRLEDWKSPYLSPRKKVLYDQWIISPNKFLVTLPENLIPDKMKINIIRALLSEIKDADKDYMLFFDIDRIDPYIFPMLRYPTIDYQRGEIFRPEDEHHMDTVTLNIVDFPLDVAGRYDTNFVYNLNLRYDDPPSNEVISILQRFPLFEEAPSVADGFEITLLDNPRIPRNFTATANEETGDITFTVSSSQDDTTAFELHHAAAEDGEYELVEVAGNLPDEGTVAFQHSAKESEKRYYKTRAVSNEGASLWTLPINVDAI